MKTEQLAEELLKKLKAQGRTLATAESCTGGGIGHLLTSISGSSAVYLGGVISYQNEVKERLLRVPAETLKQYTAVSEETAKAMAEGCRAVLQADLAISVTGLAGPNSDDSGKPVGLVYVGACNGTRTVVRENHFSGDREEVRNQAIHAAIALALELAG